MKDPLNIPTLLEFIYLFFPIIFSWKGKLGAMLPINKLQLSLQLINQPRLNSGSAWHWSP